MKKAVILLIPIIFFCHTIYGQEIAAQPLTAYPAEDLRVHLTQTCLFPGEVMGFKIYCSNPLFPELELSRIAFIELVSERNASILRKKILLEHGAGGGEFVLPDDLNSGIYTVLAYTNWLKNFGEGSFDMKSIMIVNPDQAIVQVSDSCNSLRNHRPGQETSDNSRSGLMLLPDKEQYATREKVSLKVIVRQGEGQGAGGFFSVSVCRTEPALYREQSGRSERRPEIQAKEMEYLPDFNGMRLTGKMEDASGNAMQGARIILSEPGPGTKIKSTLTDNEGNFHFLLKAEEGEKDIVFTLPDNNTLIKLEEPFWNGFRNPPVHQELCLNDSSASFLEEKYYHFQLQKKFNQSNFSERGQTDKNSKDNESFYTHYSRLIRMDDYILLDSLPEYFYELLPYVRFIQNRGNYDIRVMDPVSSVVFKEKPGVFVDGVLYSDFNEIARIPVKEIENIAVLTETYYYRDFSFGGIVDLHTIKSDFYSVRLSPNMIRLIYPLASECEMKVDVPDYSLPDSLDRIPDFRYLIYWEPNVTIDASGEKTIRFFTGDVPGDFTVKVCGLSPDGRIIRSETKIRIGKEPEKEPLKSNISE